MPEEIYLPPHPTKKELANYYGYAKTVSLYTLVLTVERIKRANLEPTFIRSRHCQRIPASLANIIYHEDGIKSLK